MKVNYSNQYFQVGDQWLARNCDRIEIVFRYVILDFLFRRTSKWDWKAWSFRLGDGRSFSVNTPWILISLWDSKPLEAKFQALDELAEQAQELDMGYEPNSDEEQCVTTHGFECTEIPEVYKNAVIDNRGYMDFSISDE